MSGGGKRQNHFGAQKPRSPLLYPKAQLYTLIIRRLASTCPCPVSSAVIFRRAPTKVATLFPPLK